MAEKWRKKGPLHTSVVNPRHEVWVEDESGIRKITTDTPGDETIAVGGRTYRHTREIGSGQWVYTVQEIV